MKTEDFAAIIFGELSGLPVGRRSNQFYVYLNLESPAHPVHNKGITTYIYYIIHSSSSLYFTLPFICSKFEKSEELLQPINDLHSGLGATFSLRRVFPRCSPPH